MINPHKENNIAWSRNDRYLIARALSRSAVHASSLIFSHMGVDTIFKVGGGGALKFFDIPRIWAANLCCSYLASALEVSTEHS